MQFLPSVYNCTIFKLNRTKMAVSEELHFSPALPQCPAFVLGKKSILEIIHQQQKKLSSSDHVQCVWVFIVCCLYSVSSF